MKALVLGGSYFIGRVLVEKLVSAGVQTTVLNRGSRQQVIPKNVELLIADRYNGELMRNHLADRHFDVVFDLSAYDLESVEISYSFLREKIRRYIFLSSIAVCRQPPKNWPITEDHEKCQSVADGEYGYGKLQAERFLLGNSFGYAPVIVVRPTYVYGQYDYNRRVIFLFERIENNALVVLRGNGDNIIQFGHVEDLADALMVLSNHEKACGQIFNISGVDLITVKQFVEVIALAFNKRAKYSFCRQEVNAYDEISSLPDVHRFADVTKAKDVLGIVPKILLYEGIKKTIQWWKEKGSNERNILGKTQ